MCVSTNSSNYYLLLNNTRLINSNLMNNETRRSSCIIKNVRLDEFINLLFLDNSNAFSFLIIIHQALWPNG